MATVQILTDGSPTPSLNHTLGQPVTFTNIDNTPGLTYLWELVEDPAWNPPLASIPTVTTNPAAASFTITPMKRGSYLIRLTLNPNTPGQVTGTTVLAIQHDNFRIPAIRETTEAGVDGWGTSVQDALDQLDNLLTNAVTQYGDASDLEDVTAAAESAGVLDKAARADHKHDIAVAAGLDIGSLDEQGGLGTSSALARSDHQHGTTPQNPGTAMGSDLSAWKLYSTDAIIQQKLLTQGIVLIAQATDMSAVDPNCHIVLANTSVAGFTLTLPAAAGTMQETNLGRLLRIKNIGTNNLTISPATGNTIDGAGGLSVGAGGSTDLVSDGAAWWVLSSQATLVDDAQIATSALSGYHVNRAINVSPPLGQWYVTELTGLLVAGDEVQLEVSYGPNGTVANQVFVFDNVVPGKITVPILPNPLGNLVSAINNWASTLAVPLPCIARYVAGATWYLFATDEWSISTDSSYTSIVSLPAAMTTQSQGGTSAPIPLSHMRIERTITADEAAVGYFFVSPGTQSVYSGTLPTVTRYQFNFGVWSTDNSLFYSVVEQPGTFGLIWLISANATVAGDRFIIDFASQQQPLTPRP